MSDDCIGETGCSHAFFKFLFDYDYVMFIKGNSKIYLALKIPVFMFWLKIIRFCDSVRNRFEIGSIYFNRLLLRREF